MSAPRRTPLTNPNGDTVTSIYLAGKIAQNDWRHDLLGHQLRGAWEWDEEAPSTHWPVIERGILGTFDYVGPYFMSDDHGCGHGASTHGCGTDGFICGFSNPAPRRAQVRDLCFDAIDRADIVFAWLDDPTAYGTLVEIGYARGRGKQVIVAAPQRPNGFKGMYGPDELYDGPEIPEGPVNDLWFAFSCAIPIVAKTPREALGQMVESVGRLQSPIEESFWQAYLTWMPHGLEGLKVQVPALGGKYRIDFGLPDQKVGIELDGYTWHSSPKAFTSDRERQRELELDGWRIIRFSGAEIKNDAARCVLDLGEVVLKFLAVVLVEEREKISDVLRAGLAPDFHGCCQAAEEGVEARLVALELLVALGFPLLGEGGGFVPADCAVFCAGGEGGFRRLVVGEDLVDLGDCGAVTGFL